jgi:lipooligosaccharide transport system permease protein
MAADRPGRLERTVLTGVLVREVVNFGSYWRASTFSSTVEPTISLIAFGFGFGSLVSTVNGLDYVQFVGTGTVATAVLFSSVFPAMFGTFVKRGRHRGDRHRRGAVDRGALRDLRCVPMLVAMVFGLDPSWGMLLVPFIAFVAGYGWASFGILISAVMKSIDNFSYVTSTVITPLFLVAGTFFPISGLPEWARILANVNPLYHCVQLVRDAVFGLDRIDFWHLGFN